jgi:hypothetical protein
LAACRHADTHGDPDIYTHGDPDADTHGDPDTDAHGNANGYSYTAASRRNHQYYGAGIHRLSV